MKDYRSSYYIDVQRKPKKHDIQETEGTQMFLLQVIMY